MHRLARAPSNIALIKYMGKADATQNIPANSSISLTLDRLCTFAELKKVSFQPTPGLLHFRWIPAPPETGPSSLSAPLLSEAGVNRVIRHAERVRKLALEIYPQYGLKPEIQSQFEIRSANTFPSSAGIASSASSFAAITLATALACAEDPEKFELALKNENDLKNKLIQASRQGSGSSCRSFGGPWVYWEKETVSEISSALPKMTDLVFLISTQAKETSSSEAHSRVTRSPLWTGRTERAENRAQNLKSAILQGHLPVISKLAWQEMWEMHSLFHTSEEPFTFWEPDTLRVLKWLKPFLNQKSPPIVTMDAGANVHLLVPSENALEWEQSIRKHFPQMNLLVDSQGTGAICLSIA